MSNVYAIFGPTGSGKTEIAVHLARLLGTVVVNTDPAQCYDGFPILSNKPTMEHDAIADHRLVGTWPLTMDASAAQFAAEAHTAIDKAIKLYGKVVLVGGSGMYMMSALCDLEFADREVVDGSHLEAESRIAAGEWYDSLSPEAAHQQLRSRDKLAADKIHPNDRNRMVRAWEVAELGSSVAPNGNSIWDAAYRHPSVVFGLKVDRQAIRERIAERTRLMFAAGAVEEVAAVVGEGAGNVDETLSVTVAQLYGIRECIEVLRDNITREQAIQLITTRSQQYAKRQDIWARRWNGLIPIDVEFDSTEAPAIARLLVAEGSAHAIR